MGRRPVELKQSESGEEVKGEEETGGESMMAVWAVASTLNWNVATGG